MAFDRSRPFTNSSDFMEFEQVRLSTFQNWPSEAINPTELACAGFIYMHKDDMVCCPWCSTIISNWIPGSNAMDEHKKKNKNCEFVKGMAYNVPVGVNPLTMNFLPGQDECGPYNNMRLNQDEQCSKDPESMHNQKQISNQKRVKLSNGNQTKGWRFICCGFESDDIQYDTNIEWH